MGRDWLAVYTGILLKPKYRRLSIEGRAALLHVWLLAGLQAPEATWRSVDELAEQLDVEGLPPAAIDELRALGWLEVDDAGRILVHDWDDYQFAASESVRRDYERDRKREWRRVREKGRP